MDVAYAYQNIDNIPEGYEVPEGRVNLGEQHMQYIAVWMRLTDRSQ